MEHAKESTIPSEISKGKKHVYEDVNEKSVSRFYWIFTMTSA